MYAPLSFGQVLYFLCSKTRIWDDKFFIGRCTNNGCSQADFFHFANLVIDFDNIGDPDDRTPAIGVTGLLHVGLVENSPCRVISPEYLYDVRRRLFGEAEGPIAPGQALEIARKSGAAYLLAGQVMHQSGAGYALSLD